MDTKKAIIFGGALVGVGALAYLLLKGNKETTTTTNNGTTLTKDAILAVLKSLKKELFTVVL